MTSVLSSSSSKVFSDLTSSGLYHNGGWVSNSGPVGRSAMVKWNAATKVFEGVYLHKRPLGTCSARSRWSHLHYFVRLDQIVLHGLLQAQASALLIFEASHVERECSCFLLDFREDSSRGLHLELVRDRVLLLVDCGPGVFNTCLCQ